MNIPSTVLALLSLLILFSGCGATALCQKTIDLAEECSGETATAEEEAEIMDSCQDTFEDAKEISQECYDALYDLTDCIANLSCDDLEDYFVGEPGTTGYPCAAEDEVMYVDGVCG